MSRDPRPSWWFPVEVDRWLKDAPTRPHPWRELDRILDLRALVWEWGRVPYTQQELARRWGVSYWTVRLHFTDKGRERWIPDRIAAFWSARWAGRLPDELGPQ